LTAKLRLGMLASHGGTNMQAIIDACREGRLEAEPRVVISNNSASGALDRARQAGIPDFHMSGRTHPDPDVLDQQMHAILEGHGVEVICLAGYMKKVGPVTLSAYAGRILNVHPALLPKYGGRGFYGEAVHAAVLAARERESGVTVHLVDEVYDHGRILAQRVVAVLAEDTVEALAARVLEQEHALYAETIQEIASGQIRLEGLERSPES
jgi:phosphoribosylglycinamide formyltransferase-1